MNNKLINKIIDYNYGEFGTEFGDALVDIKNERYKYKIVLDKIKEYIKENANANVDYILELLEEIE